MHEQLKIKDTHNVSECGLKVQGGDLVKWYFNSTLINGQPLETSYRHLTIDANETLQGVNEGVKGLCVGGKRTIVVHNVLAYGAERTEKIPPYAHLIFHVHLVKIDRPNVGWEDLEIKRRTATVTKRRPVKISSVAVTGDCDVKVMRGDVITWSGTGYLLDGTIFDEYTNIQNTIGDGKTIRPLEKALVGLCAGDWRSITIHPDHAFGTRGVPGLVPSGATVIFDFTVLTIKKSEL
jgi:FKBP-type peptidyl-prolyl cis-trans isomerase